MNDRRLLACASLCVGKKAVDVGTDHGHLAAYLINENICESCIACDINEMPLQAARDTVKRYGLETRITLVLSDGLDKIDGEGVTDVVIAGMGGELIADIISRADWIKKNRVNLVLQPMTKWDVLRKWLYENGFEVKNEKACIEGQFVYSVMQAEYIGKQPCYRCSERYLYFGLVKAESDGREYIKRQATRISAAGNGMLKSEDKKKLGKRLVKLAQSELETLKK